MKDNLFLDYSRKHVHFYDESIPALLERGLSLVTKCRGTKPALLDLGCDDGRLLFALYRKGILTNFARVVGVDISKEKIERLLQGAWCITYTSDVEGWGYGGS